MRTSLPAGHLRPTTASTAASAPLEPSTPMTNRTGVSGSSMRPRATRTERRASCNTFCETLPKKNWPSAVWPCDPTTIRSAPHSSAFSMITVDVLDDLKSGRRRQPVLDDRQDFDLRVRGQTGPSQIVQSGVSALRAVVSDENFHSIRHVFLLLFFRVCFLPHDLHGAMRMR